VYKNTTLNATHGTKHREVDDSFSRRRQQRKSSQRRQQAGTVATRPAATTRRRQFVRQSAVPSDDKPVPKVPNVSDAAETTASVQSATAGQTSGFRRSSTTRSQVDSISCRVDYDQLPNRFDSIPDSFHSAPEPIWLTNENIAISHFVARQDNILIQSGNCNEPNTPDCQTNS